MIINPKFEISQTVYLTTDPDQVGRICTGYLVTRSEILYYLQHISTESSHYDYEITADPDRSKRMGIDKD